MVDIVSLVSIGSCSLISIIAQIQNSRCKHIKIWGMECIRDVSDREFSESDSGERGT